MKRIFALSALLLLAACSTSSPGIEVRTVEVPTPVPCVDEADIPAEPERVGDQFTGDAETDIGILAPNALELRKYGQELHALIVPACVITPEGRDAG